jgi:NADPH2:quinone reductase
MTRAIVVHEVGGPEALRLEDVTLSPPARGEARVRHTAIGLNFLDVYHRTGLYPLPRPFTPGSEAAGVVEAIGEGVREVAVGQRVAYAGGPPGAYAEARNVAASRLVPVPDGVDDRTAAAVLLKGLTAEYLIRRTYAVQPGETILVHAAAGGVGLLLCQWATLLGARVIGTVGSEAKVGLARANGCAEVLVSSREDVAARVRELTAGEGVPVVYDSVGKDTFAASLASLRPRGLFVSYGNASGPVPAVDPLKLAAAGSLYFTRPVLGHYTARRDELLTATSDLFALVRDGKLRVRVGQTFRLEDVALAHRALESRQTTGSTVLLP